MISRKSLLSHADFMLLCCRGLWLFALCNNPQWVAQIKAHLRPSSIYFASRVSMFASIETFNKFRGRICASIKNFLCNSKPTSSMALFQSFITNWWVRWKKSPLIAVYKSFATFPSLIIIILIIIDGWSALKATRELFIAFDLGFGLILKSKEML